MAVSVAAQRTHYPLAAYNYRVTLAGVDLGVAEVSGLRIDYETATYRHGLCFAEGETLVRHRIDHYVPLTLRKGVIPGVPGLRDWFLAGDPRPLDISLCDDRGQAVVTWHISRALPVKLEGPALAAGGNEPAVETVELQVAGLTLEQH